MLVAFEEVMAVREVFGSETSQRATVQSGEPVYAAGLPRRARQRDHAFPSGDGELGNRL
jgi:hypothetical protein